MKKTFFLFVLGLAFSHIVAAQSRKEKEVAQAVEALRRAMVDADKAVLESITSDELSYGHSSGKIETKAEFVETISSGKSDFVSIDLREQSIKVTGNTAIVRHKLSAQTNDGGNPGTVSLGVMLVWKKDKGKWKLIGRQAYRL